MAPCTALLLAPLSAVVSGPTSLKACHPRARPVQLEHTAPGAPQHALAAPLASAPLPALASVVQRILTLSLERQRAPPALRIRGRLRVPLGALQMQGTMMQQALAMEFGADTHTIRSTVPPKYGQTSLLMGGMELPLM